MAKWTKEEDDLIIAQREAGVLVKDVIIEGRTPAAIKARCAVVAKKIKRYTNEEIAKAVEEYNSGVLVKALSVPYGVLKRRAELDNRVERTRYTEEELRTVKELRETHTQKEIADILGIPWRRVANIVTRLIQEGVLETKVGTVKYWTEEEEKQLEELLAANLSHRSIAQILGRSPPAVANHASRLGLSSKLSFSGTKVYLVKFDGFYKIGITNHSVEQRLAKFPPYKIIEVLDFPSREIALKVEKYLLDRVDRFEPDNLPNGHTECFKSKDISSFEQLLESFTNP